SRLRRSHHAAPVSVASPSSSSLSGGTRSTVRDASGGRPPVIEESETRRLRGIHATQPGNDDFLTSTALRIRLSRLKDKERRKLIAVLFAGKMVALPIIVGAMWGGSFLFDTAAGAATGAPTHAANDFVSPINTVWVLVTAFLVFFMQAGFMGL